MPDQDSYPRLTLKCNCGNEFNVNVIRMKDKSPVLCQICGEEFPVSIGEKLAKALEDLYIVKSSLDKEGNKFKFAFIYKSTFKQPPTPYAFEEEDKKEEAESK